MAENYNSINQNYLEVELLEDRTLFLDGEINIESVGKLMKQITILQTRGKTRKRPIKLCINSPGGSIYDMLALYDTIRTSPCPIHTYVTGTAMSAAAFILMAGHKRYAYQNSRIMIHELSLFKDGYTTFTDLRVEQEENAQLMKVLTNILKTHSKLKVIESKDLYISSTIALSLGIIDEIIKNK